MSTPHRIHKVNNQTEMKIKDKQTYSLGTIEPVYHDKVQYDQSPYIQANTANNTPAAYEIPHKS